jgi:SAM-dependent methyltransferase
MLEDDRQYQRTLGEKFRSQYDDGYDVWSDEAQMRAFAPFALRSPPAPKPSTRVVDLGAGRGYDTLYFLEKGFQVTALDLFRMPEWDAIEKSHAGVVEFVPRSLLDWGLGSRCGEATLVIDNGCYHHQARSTQASYLRKVRALLAPGGKFAVNVFCSRGGCRADSVTLKDGRLVHIYDEQHLRSELAAAGFAVTRTLIMPRPQSSFAYDYLYVIAIKTGP